MFNMPRLFYATCVTGLERVAREALHTALADVSIERGGDGFLLFRAEAGFDALRRLRFFNNVFAVLSWQEELSVEQPLKSLAAAVRDDAATVEALEQMAPKGGRFTVMASVGNQPASIPHFALEKLEKMLSAAGHYEVDRQHPQLTFWLMVRDEGFGFFGLRITRGTPAVPQGALRPELCYLLCLLSSPRPEDVFLDPHCGSGAIALERAAAWPATEVWACDNDAVMVERAAAEAERRKLAVRAQQMDALRLEKFQPQSVSAIVTDPPWGIFKPGSPDLGAMLQSFRRVLKSDGRAVLLLGRDMGLSQKSIDAAGFLSVSRDAILVSGQKATVHVLKPA